MLHIFKDEDAKIAADIALKHRLYVSGWCLSGDLKKVRKTALGKVALWYDENGKPVGVAVKESNGCLGVFVRKSNRKQGIGKKLVESLKTQDSFAWRGIDGSVDFWNKTGVECRVW